MTWIVLEDGNLLNLARVREIVLEAGDAEEEHKVVAYDSDPLHAENLWVLYSDVSSEACERCMKVICKKLEARSVEEALQNG